MVRGIVFLFLAFSGLANGNEDIQIFYGEDRVPAKERPAELSRNLKAVRGFALGGRDCTFVQTSSSGYALTSRHCISEYLARNRAVSDVKDIALSNATVSYLVYDKEFVGKLRPEMDEKIRVSFPYDSEKVDSVPKGIVKTPFKVVAVPDGEILGRKLLSPETGPVLRDHNIGIFSDFALIKLNTENKSCVKTGDVKNGGTVHAIGFPQFAEVIDFENERVKNAAVISLGYDCFSDQGTYRQQLANLGNLLTVVERLEINTMTDYLKKFQRENADLLISHSAHIAPGNSGGGLFNDRGELIGVNNSIMNIFQLTGKPTLDYMPGAYVANPISEIKRYLKAHLSAEEYKEAFRCDEDTK